MLVVRDSMAKEVVTVRPEMAAEVVTARPEDPIEEAAMEMYERKIGCLPVVGDDGLVGIVTSSDVMRAFVRLVGGHEPGSRVEVALSRRPGAFAGVAGILQNAGANIVSVLASSKGEDEAGERVAVFRIDTIDPRRVVEGLEAAGYAVRWPPGAGNAGDHER